MEGKYTASITIAYSTPEHAVIIKDCLDVDSELQPDRVSKEVVVEESNIVVYVITC
jgi:hypothetical protein